MVISFETTFSCFTHYYRQYFSLPFSTFFLFLGPASHGGPMTGTPRNPDIEEASQPGKTQAHSVFPPFFTPHSPTGINNVGLMLVFCHFLDFLFCFRIVFTSYSLRTGSFPSFPHLSSFFLPFTFPFLFLESYLTKKNPPYSP